EIDSAVSVSGPNSLHARLSQQQGSQMALNQLVGGSMKTLHCELDVRHDTLSGEGNAPIMAIVLPQHYRVVLTFGDVNSLGACVINGPCSIALFNEPASGTWTRLAIELDIEGAQGTIAQGKVGSALVQVGTVNSPEALPGYNGGFQLSLGMLSPYNP